MDDLEPTPNFYAQKQYGEPEKKLLHHATVSVLNFYIINNEDTKLSKNGFLLYFSIKISKVLVLNLSFAFLMIL